MKTPSYDFSRVMGKNILAAVLIGFVCVLAYFNSLHNDFLIDDYAIMLNNPQFHNIEYFWRQLIPDLDQYLRIESQNASPYYRPVACILFMISYLMFGNDPFGYHVLNLILFSGMCWTIFLLCKELFGDFLTAFLTAVLYAVHPVNGVFVNYILASCLAVQVAALSLSMLLFLKAVKGQKPGVYFFLSIFLFILALLCHETSFVFPLLLAAAAFLGAKIPVKRTVKITSGYFAVAAGYLIFRLFFASLQSGLFNKILVYDLSLGQHVASFAAVAGWYFSRLIYPQGIVLMWSTLPVQEHIFWINLIFFLCVILCFCLVWRYRNRNKIMATGILFLLIGFLPVTLGSMLDPVNGFMIEPQWMYFPSIGFFFMTAAALRRLLRDHPKTFVCMMLLIVVPWLILTWKMNRIWSSELSYASYWAREVPHDRTPKYFKIHAYYLKENDEQAVKHLLELLDGSFYDYRVYENLGVIALANENLKKAEEYLEKALAIAPWAVVAQSNLAQVYEKQGKEALAEKHFLQAITYNPYVSAARVSLALLYERQGRSLEARRLYEKNLSMNPHDTNTLFHLTDLYLKQGKKDRAADSAIRFLEASDDAESLARLGVRCARGNVIDPAVALFKKTIELDSDNPFAYVELGKIFANYEEWREAYFVWNLGARKTNDWKTFEDLIKRAQDIERNPKER